MKETQSTNQLRQELRNLPKHMVANEAKTERKATVITAIKLGTQQERKEQG